MTAKEHGIVHNIEETEKMVPPITSESALGQYVSKLISGAEVFDLNLWIKIDPVNRPIKRNSEGFGYVSHRQTFAFDDHLEDRFVLFRMKGDELRRSYRKSSDASIGTCFTLCLHCNKVFPLRVWCGEECQT